MTELRDPVAPAGGNSARHRMETRLHRSERALRTLIDCNHILARDTDEPRMLCDVCALLVDSGYALAAVTLAAAEPGEAPRTFALAREPGAPGAAVRRDDDEGWADELGRPVLAGAGTIVCQDVAETPGWGAAALARGYRSAICLPLAFGPAERAALSIFCRDPDRFDADEEALLTELAQDLSFGIQAARSRAALEEAERHLGEQTAQLERLLEASPTVLYRMQYAGDRPYLTEVSPNIARILGCSAAEACIPAWWLAHVHPEDREAAALLPRLATESDQFARDYRLADEEGRYRWVHDNVRVTRDAAGRPIALTGSWAEVTPLKEAERHAAREAARLADSQAIARIASWEADVATGSMYWSRETARIFAVGEVDLAAGFEHFLPLVLPADRDAVAAWWRRILAGDEAPDLEFRARGAAGDVVWIAGRGRMQCDDEGRPACAAGTFQEVTERKRSTELAQLQARRAEVLLALPVVIESLTDDAFVQHCLDAMETLTDSRMAFGHSVNGGSQPGTRSAWALGAARDRALAAARAGAGRAGRWRETLATSQPLVLNDADAGPDGIGRMLAVPVTEGGRVVLVACVADKAEDYTAQDVETVQLIANAGWRLVTSRRRARHLTKLSRAVEQSPVGTIITDVDCRIEYANAATLAHTGYSLEEMLGATPSILKSGKTPPETYREMWAALNAGNGWRGQFCNRRRDGSEFVESATITPVRDEQGVVTHYIAVGEDVTERIRTEEELRQHRERLEELVLDRTADLVEARRQAEAANAAKSEFLANMSHEIRTPMNAIIGMAHLMQEEELSATNAVRLEKIDRAAHHLLSIINDILDLSAIESGRFTIDSASFRLADVLDSVVSIVADAAAGKRLALSVDAGGVPASLRGDPTRLRQALLNYAGNAVKFTEMGFVALRVRVAAEDERGILLRFEVEDSGIGVPAHKQPELFSPFAQVDTSTSRRHEGTGLGLAITRRLARLMGGDSGMTSTEGKGSTFWFTARVERAQELPPRPSAPQPGSAKQALLAHHRGRRVLVVEDNEINREVAAHLLRVAGLACELAVNGQEAVDMVARQPFAAVLMDVRMPVLNGLGATRAIRAQHAASALPIIAMTASAFGEDRDECFAAGMNDYLAKPVSPESLYRTLLKWFPEVHAAAAAAAAAAPPEPVPPAAGPANALPELPGIDRKQGLTVADGDGDRYLRVLRRFARSQPLDAAKLGPMLAAGDRDGAAMIAHSLAGAAANLGAVDVAAPAKALEEGLRGGRLEDAPARELVGRIDAQLRKLAGALAALPVATEDDAAARGTLPDPALVARIRQLIEQSDVTAAEIVHAARHELRALFGARVMELESLLANFDFEGAAHWLAKVVAERDTMGVQS
ncbi:MAG: PAS domain-containing protein [Burkholderiales bacterium]